MKVDNFELEIDKCVLVAYWNMPARSMNVIDETVIVDLENLVSLAVSNTDIKGVVLASRKKDFSAGADLSVLKRSKNEYDRVLAENGEDFANSWFLENSSHLSKVLRKIETCGKPFACAIHGVCLGGAFELALACHYRVMVADNRSKVGLPEVSVGIFPGAGGTQRVSRLTETSEALKFLLKGRPIDAVAARKMNLVDTITPDLSVVELAKDWVIQVGNSVAPWDKKDFKLPSGKVFSAKGMNVWPAANAHYRKETYDNYPGARAILTAVYEGLQVDIDTGLRIESRLFANVLRSSTAEAMINSLFLAKTNLDKGIKRPANIEPTSIKKIGVVGAGFMGSGIAYVAASNNLEVVFIDSTVEKANIGKATIDKMLTDKVKKGRLNAANKAEVLSRIIATADYSLLSDVDLVVEAVFEDREVKKLVLSLIHKAVKPNVVIASNTSTLPISSLAAYTKKPSQFVGIHFFSPVDKMQLVEVIKGKKTSEYAVATALDFIKLIKKTPIVVNDSRGFFANRCVMSYIKEGHLMLAEGVPPAVIENVARMAGMPVGPLALNDEVGIDLAWKILQATKSDLGSKAVDPVQEQILDFMVNTNSRYGRKNSQGFYEYKSDGKKVLWDGLSRLQQSVSTFDVDELKQRFLYVQSAEAIRTIAEGIVTDTQEADVGSIFGFGFPPFTGGVISYVKQIGKDQFTTDCNKLAKKYGKRFKLPKKFDIA